ncbi:PEPxxWA-CTERM sorting domain-containing protein [Sphingomonas bacterium]|uniref:PEPxxWA-CTERM sorting domain-containing protein n=1 Tax=Sphingomonas bacterium TaxID=1895847 RepID=UPI001576A78B|nr:PEPxxWA-CTERM sorting domain-containing protein [Sphingomonas bacterium]
MISRRFKKLLGLGISLGMAVGVAQSADAAFYTVSTAKIDPSAGSLNGTVHMAPSFNEDASIGRILLTGTTSSGQSFTFDSFCVDLFDSLTAPATFYGDTLSALGLSTTKNNQLTALLANIDSFINAGITGTDTGSKAERSAAAQMAVWEIVNETTNIYDVDTDANKGAFYVSNVGGVDNLSGKSLSDAATLLANVTSGAWTSSSGFKVAVVKSSGNQTQVVYGASAASVLSALPEPGSWGMMVMGFGVLGVAMRRKRAPLHAIA